VADGLHQEQSAPGGPCAARKPVGARLDELLRAVLPLEVCSSAPPPQRGPGSMGATEVQAAETSRAGVDALAGAHRAAGPEALRPVATWHPEKTRLLMFGRYAEKMRTERGLGKPETFSFLGLTHICGRTGRGKFLLIRRTMRKRMQAKLREVKAELQRRRRRSIPEQGAWLRAGARGYFAYHAVPTNGRTLLSFRTQVIRLLQRSLRRRGQRDRTNWQKMGRLVRRWIPPARIRHPWPEERFDVRTQGKSPVR